MDTQRALLAIVISFTILLGYQYLFLTPADETQPPAEQQSTSPTSVATPAITAQELPQAAAPLPLAAPVQQGRDITLDNSLYTAVFTEAGGALKSLRLKNYKEERVAGSPAKELIKTKKAASLPLLFSWGAEPAAMPVPLMQADTTKIDLSAATGSSAQAVTMQTRLSNGLEITRRIEATAGDYRMKVLITVHNPTEQNLQGQPFLQMTHAPFSGNGKTSYVFQGPSLLLNDKKEEIKPADLEKKGPRTLTGAISWVAYEGTYFIAAVLPENKPETTVRLSTADNQVRLLLSGKVDVIPARGFAQYSYTLYYGPKKMDILKGYGHGLDKALDFGWFDPLAKPTLILLNTIHGFLPNYGLAIILVTVLIKLLFWPIAQKGMKSMKNMQKLQPKIAKMKERFKDDPARMNQEMMSMYKTYKVNPLGGCLPMVLQIPVFFALYKVLLQAIELRHAPFMLWINDLSAPDRLWIGFDLPFLGGIPVLTLLMGASMFLQQKMTPTAADPAQAKIMMFLPIIFTVMFVNFASGLVLYWFINNLLSILQQYLINRRQEA